MEQENMKKNITGTKIIQSNLGGGPIVLLGAGREGRRALFFYGEERVYAFCDNNKELWGTKILGKPVWSYAMLKEYLMKENFDIVLSVSRMDAVRNIIDKLRKDDVAYRYFSDEEQSSVASNEECFTNIYKNHRWGSEVGQDFYSGSGSHTKTIIYPYIDTLTRLIVNNELHHIVEIGCGDFFVMGKVLENLRVKDFDYEYRGMDVVADLVVRNQKMFGCHNVNFSCVDASSSESELPAGDICIIRQVLQHLSNADILCILDKVKKYRYLLVTEHIYEGEGIQYNLDKGTGANIRLNKCSGVYLEQPPYDRKNIVHLLRIPEYGGIIRTSLIIQ